MTQRPRFGVLAFAFCLAIPCPARADEADGTVPDLIKRQTLELIAAISTGSAGVWDRYLDPGLRYVDETGTVMTKKEMVDQTRPLPAGVSGHIDVVGFDVAVHGDVAVATYVDDEFENYHGHALHCQYRTTETWMKSDAGWRIIAGQVLALRTDPPAVMLAPALRRQYCGQYALTPEIGYEIRCTADGLEGQQTGRAAEPLRAEAPDVLFVPGKTRYRYVILRDAGGKITGFAQRREAWDIVWTRKPEAPKS